MNTARCLSPALISLILLINVRDSEQNFLSWGGKCEDHKCLTPIKWGDLSGTWLERNRTGTFVLEGPSRCNTIKFCVNEHKKLVVTHSFVTHDGKRETITGESKEKLPGGGQVTIIYDKKILGKKITVPLCVLCTDYSSYAVLSSCSSALFVHTNSVIVLTRELHPVCEEEVEEDIYQCLVKNKIKPHDLKPTNQTARDCCCYYWAKTY